MKILKGLLIYLITMSLKCEEEQQVSIEELKDRTHFENFDMVKSFMIVDVDPESLNTDTPKGFYYYFNMLSNKPSGIETTPNKFYFDMFYYNQSYPAEPKGSTDDETSLDLKTPKEIIFSESVVSNIKLKNNFYKAEVSISNNSCLTLFLFMDTREDTEFEMFENRHDFLFNMSQSSNNFHTSLEKYFGHSKDSFDIVYNDLETDQNEVYLKVVCPYFSVFGNKSVSLSINLIPIDEPFSCKIFN